MRNKEITLCFTTLNSQLVFGQLLGLCGLETVTPGLSILWQAEERLHIWLVSMMQTHHI